MTDLERRLLEDMERELSVESPELARLLTGVSRSSGGPWIWLGAVTAVVSCVLLGLAVALGVVALAVFAICPPLTVVVLRAWECHRARARRPDPARRTSGA